MLSLPWFSSSASCSSMLCRTDSSECKLLKNRTCSSSSFAGTSSIFLSPNLALRSLLILDDLALKICLSFSNFKICAGVPSLMCAVDVSVGVFWLVNGTRKSFCHGLISALYPPLPLGRIYLPNNLIAPSKSPSLESLSIFFIW